MKPWPSCSIVVVTLLLTACGGGSSSATSASSPTSVNSVPSVAPSASFTMAENIAHVGMVAATDADNDPLTYAIAGGVDAALFQVSAAGRLSFRAAPDYEVPRDSDSDNVYAVDLSVGDGKAVASQRVVVTVTNVATSNFQVRRLAGGFNQPNNLVALPGAPDTLLVTEKGGLVRSLSRATGVIAARPLLDLSAEVATDGARGLMGVAVPADFAQSRSVFFSLVTPAGLLEVRRYRANAAGDALDPASVDVILQVPSTSNRYVGGWIGFGSDNYLYVATGSGSRTPGESTTDLLGKVLRIDPSIDAFPTDPLRDYVIPTANPYARGGGLPEIWASGFRNPRRASFDPAFNELWVGDYGLLDGGVELGEIDLIRASDAGSSYAPDYPSRLAGSDPVPAVPAGSLYPAASVVRGLSAFQFEEFWVAGYVYRGPVETFQGHFVIGNSSNSNVYTFLVDLSTRAHNHRTYGTPADRPQPGLAIYAYGEDAQRNLYSLTVDGQIFVLEAVS